MEKNQNRAFTFICLNNPKKFSFSIMLSPGDIEYIMFDDFIKMAKNKANELGTGIGKLYDFYKNAYEENSVKVKNKTVAYFQNLFPFKFEEEKKIKIKVLFKNEFKNNEEEKEIEIFPYSTIKVLREAVTETFSCPIQEQKLLLGDVILSDSLLMLFEYNIKEGSTITLNIVETKESSGGSAFADLSENKFKDRNFSKTAPKYRVCYPGINIEGICKTKNCEAYNKQVICPLIKREVFDLISDSHEIVCPLCKCNIDPLTCGFTCCSYTWAGIKLVDRKKIPFQRAEYTRIGNFYRLFDKKESEEITKWVSLTLVVKIHETEEDDKTLAQIVFCAFCNENDSKNIKMRKDLNYNLHDKCYFEFKDVM